MRTAAPTLAALALALTSAPVPTRAADSGQLLYATEGNRLRRVDVDTIGEARPLSEIFVQRASLDPDRGRDLNGMICAFPDGSGRFVAGEDTNQPSPPPGWGVFAPDGTQVGKLTATYFVSGAEPFGCAFDAAGRLFTTEVGSQGFGPPDGQLLLWFPPYDRFPGPPGAYPDTHAASGNFCKLAVDIGTAGGVAVDALGRVYVASASSTKIERFSPPFPTGPDAAGGCGATDALGSPLADAVQRETFVQGSGASGLLFFTGLAIAPNGNLYAASVLNGTIGEFDLDGNLVRLVLDPPETLPPIATGTPQGLAVDAQGTLYYADLDLQGLFPFFSPGPDGKVWRIRFDEHGDPLAPEIVLRGLAFPDGVALLPGQLQRTEWRTLAGGPRRTFMNARESIVTPDNVAGLGLRWRFPTRGIITGSPAVAVLDLPGRGPTQVAIFLSWDANVYAVRTDNGSLVWRFETDPQPGASFPQAASVTIQRVDGEERVFVGSGETLYALDAATGSLRWRFVAGTGCRDAAGNPPGLCGFGGERNEIESTALVADGKVLFGMDVNESTTGKGGFYAVDAAGGHLAWFFDLESGRTCRPLPDDRIRRYDGYHSEAELGLPPEFFLTRPGCDADRTTTGCGNVWSSPAWDSSRGLLYFTSSNCDTDSNPATPRPPPPMPPFDEAIVALRLDGTPAWRWRPREVDNDDLAFGATPNLFTIQLGGAPREVLGVGNKDGTYTVLDRDGHNEVTGVRWESPDPSGLPYWRTRVVPGGSIGGIVGTAAVDESKRRIFLNTAPGFDPVNPQQPTVHGLDMDSGAVVWQNGTGSLPLGDASFGPTSAIPGVAFVGAVVAPLLRAYRTDADDGSLLLAMPVPDLVFGAAVASGAAVVDGLVLVGSGVGTRTDDPSDLSDRTSRLPRSLVAFCVPGTAGCAACDDGLDNDADGTLDAADPECTDPADLSEGPDCRDGLDNDGDGLTDRSEDPGCSSADDLAERGTQTCDDGVDDDGDGWADYPNDPGCALPASAQEDPACDDGLDNDGDGRIDFGRDPECGSRAGVSEETQEPSCGLGAELALAALALTAARRRDRSAHQDRAGQALEIGVGRHDPGAVTARGRVDQ